MNRRLFLTSSAATVSLAFLAPLSGCGKVNQSQLAALAQALGTSAANLATILGQTALAQKITQLTSQAVGDIQTWTPGSTTTDIIQVLGDLETVINQIPVTPEVQGLILLALGTIQGILALFPPAAGAVAAKTTAPHVTLAKVPKTKADYATQWNALIDGNAKFAAARI